MSMNPNISFQALLSQSINDNVIEVGDRIVCGETVKVYDVKRYCDGCRLKFYCDGEECEIVGSYWVYGKDMHGRERLKLTFTVRYDDGETELFGAAMLASATAVLEVPARYHVKITEQKRKRICLEKYFNIVRNEEQ